MRWRSRSRERSRSQHRKELKVLKTALISIAFDSCKLLDAEFEVSLSKESEKHLWSKQSDQVVSSGTQFAPRNVPRLIDAPMAIFGLRIVRRLLWSGKPSPKLTFTAALDGEASFVSEMLYP
jgi:hypothetical protein